MPKQKQKANKKKGEDVPTIKQKPKFKSSMLVIAGMIATLVGVYYIWNTFAADGENNARYQRTISEDYNKMKAEVAKINGKSFEKFGEDVDEVKAKEKEKKLEQEVPSSAAYIKNIQEMANEMFGVKKAEAASCSTLTSYTAGRYGTFDVYAYVNIARKNQDDAAYGDSRYGAKSYCSSYGTAGCGPSALAMSMQPFISWWIPVNGVGGFISKTFPIYRDSYTSGSPCNSGTKADAMTSIPYRYTSSDGYVLQSRKVYWASAYDAIKKGNPVIVKTTNPCFTSGGHYLVAVGYMKRKSDSAEFVILRDSGPRNIVAASAYEVSKNAEAFYVVNKSSTRR